MNRLPKEPEVQQIDSDLGGIEEDELNIPSRRIVPAKRSLYGGSLVCSGGNGVITKRGISVSVRCDASYADGKCVGMTTYPIFGRQRLKYLGPSRPACQARMHVFSTYAIPSSSFGCRCCCLRASFSVRRADASPHRVYTSRPFG